MGVEELLACVAAARQRQSQGWQLAALDLLYAHFARLQPPQKQKLREAPGRDDPAIPADPRARARQAEAPAGIKAPKLAVLQVLRDELACSNRQIEEVMQLLPADKMSRQGEMVVVPAAPPMDWLLQVSRTLGVS